MWEDYSGLLDSYCAVLGIVIAGICTILAGIVTQNHRSRAIRSVLGYCASLELSYNTELRGNADRRCPVTTERRNDIERFVRCL